MNENTKADVVRLTSEMVRIKSYSFMERQEEEISKYIEDFFKARGIKTWRKEIVPGRYNTFAILEGTDPRNAPSLLLTGHMDTVPAYDFEKAFEPWEDEDNVYGRGTVDMKGPLAAMMCAMTEIKDCGVQLKGDLVFAGVADEEEQGIGTRSLIETGPHTDYAIIGEPTDYMKICLGHKGLEWIEVIFRGHKVHGGNQGKGINAIMMAGRFLERLEKSYIPQLAKRTHPVLGQATLNVGTIIGGDQPSTVPDLCKIRLDRRCLTSETIEQVYRELQNIADALHSEDPGFSCEIRDVFGGTTLPHIPFCTDRNSPLVQACENAIKKYGEEPVIGAFPAWSDAGFMAAGTDSQCIVMGPGELGVAHSVHEYISKAELRKAVAIYKEVAISLCK